MIHEVTFRAVLDDGTTIEWGTPIVVDGVEKEASIDDIDRSKLSNLLTVNADGVVIHSLGFPPEERKTKLAVWRHNVIIPAGEEARTAGAYAGYNQLFPDGHTELKLDFIDPKGVVYSAAGADLSLHPKEVFTPEEAQAIRYAQAEENARTEADNFLLANPTPVDIPDAEVNQEPIITTDGNPL